MRRARELRRCGNVGDIGAEPSSLIALIEKLGVRPPENEATGRQVESFISSSVTIHQCRTCRRRSFVNFQWPDARGSKNPPAALLSPFVPVLQTKRFSIFKENYSSVWSLTLATEAQRRVLRIKLTNNRRKFRKLATVCLVLMQIEEKGYQSQFQYLGAINWLFITGNAWLESGRSLKIFA